MNPQILQAFHAVENNRKLKPVWVEVWIGGEEIATIDWENRLAVRNFAAIADHMLRNRKDIRTVPLY